MKSKSIIISICTIGLMVLGACSVEPEYYSQTNPSTFFDSPDKVYQRMARPFTHWAWSVSQEGPKGGMIRLQGLLTTDEMCHPTRDLRHWYDGGQYQGLYRHNFNLSNSHIEESWRLMAMGIAQTWSAKDDLETVDFAAIGFNNPEEARADVINQLNTLAGFFFLSGLDMYGGLPLYTTTHGDVLPRSSAEETFAFTENLLKEGIEGCLTKQAGEPITGMIRKAVPAMLLARLYFNAEVYIGKPMYTEAAQICQDIIDGKYGPYELDDDFQDTFGFTNDKDSKEIIWAVPSDNKYKRDAGYGTSLYYYTALHYMDNSEPGRGNNGFSMTPSLTMDSTSMCWNRENSAHPGHTSSISLAAGPYKLGCPFIKFEDNDVRKKPYLYKGGGQYEGMFCYGLLINPLTQDTTFYTGENSYKNKTAPVNIVDQMGQLSPDYNTADGPRKEGFDFAEENSGVRLIKWMPIPNVADKDLYGNPDIPVLRLTETYYTLAECKYRAGDKAGAASLINKVRERYFRTTGGDPNPVTATNLDDYRMLDEWLIEFLGEGRRRTDLVRFNKYVTEDWFDHKATNNSNLNRFPIPQSVMTANPQFAGQQNPGYE